MKISNDSRFWRCYLLFANRLLPADNGIQSVIDKSVQNAQLFLLGRFRQSFIVVNSSEFLVFFRCDAVIRQKPYHGRTMF